MHSLLAMAADLRSAQPSLDSFCSFGGSIRGREHERLGRNNQDAWALRRTDDCLVAVVCDGCSAGSASEVGAQLACRFIASGLPSWLSFDIAAGRVRELVDMGAGRARLVDSELVTARFAERISREVGRFLRSVLWSLSPESDSPRIGSRRQPLWLFHLRELMLFTLLIAVVGKERFAILGCGDGLYGVNGDVHELDAGPQNAPGYLAYQLLDGDDCQAANKAASVSLHVSGKTAELESLLIATDGAHDLIARKTARLEDGQPIAGLEPFVREPRYLQNPSLLQKRLRVIADAGQLADDTTLAVIRRQAPARAQTAQVSR